MAYSKKEIETKFKEICLRITEGEAVRNILRDEGLPSMRTFWKWLGEDEEKVKQYARAKELYAEGMFEDIILISDGTDDDVLVDEEGNRQVNHEIIQRDRLRTDNRKWVLARLNPRKYGDKNTTVLEGGEKPIIINFED